MIYKTGWEALGFKSYQDFLKSYLWKQKKEIILEVKGKRCQKCYSESNLEIHHLHYNTLGNESSKDVLVLCGNCHRKLHLKKINEKEKKKNDT